MRRPTKACPFCESRVRFVDYKDERTLGRFITDHGKILPSRLSGVDGRQIVIDDPNAAQLLEAFQDSRQQRAACHW